MGKLYSMATWPLQGKAAVPVPSPIKPLLKVVTSRTGTRTRKKKPSVSQLENDLLNAGSYAEWVKIAKALDASGVGNQWKQEERSALYDYRAVAKRLARLKSLRRRRNSRGLVFALEEGIHGNLGGIGKPALYNRAHFGTKKLITDYIDTVAETLLYIESLPDSEIPPDVKLDLFKRASHCYGRSAIMFSGGGQLIYFHFGVIKSLLEQDLLPSVLSGSSAGSLVCAMIGTRTSKALADFLATESFSLGGDWQPNYFERATGVRRMLTFDDLEQTLPNLVPDLTFREAFEISGRHISISVSPNERHNSPRLLNAITSPHVLIRSAVRASCAVPGIFEPVQLEARDAHGKTVPYLESRWIDGLVAADLPAKQLARLYGTNHYIVSLINPLSLPTFRDHKLHGPGLLSLKNLFKNVMRQYIGSTDAVIAKLFPSSSIGAVNKIIHDLLSQKYVGDIVIVPEDRVFSPFKLLSPYTQKEIAALMKEGERQTWPRVEMIRNSSKISRTLDGILRRAGDDGHAGY